MALSSFFTVTNNTGYPVALWHDGTIVDRLRAGQTSSHHSEPGVYQAEFLYVTQPPKPAPPLPGPIEVLLEVNVSRIKDTPDKTYTTTRNNGSFFVGVYFEEEN